MDATRPLLFFDSGVGGLSVLDAIRAPAAAGPDRLCRRFGRLPLRHQERGGDRRARARAARPAGRALSSAPDRDRLQHRLDDRAGRRARRARPADRRHRARDQARRARLADARDRRARHRRDRAPALCRPISPPSSRPTAPSLRHGSARLVELAEAALRGEPARSGATIARVLDGLLGQPGGDAIDTVVLACTHFPLVADELAAARAAPAHLRRRRAKASRAASPTLTEGQPWPDSARATGSRCSPSDADTAALQPALGCARTGRIERL